MGGIMDNDRKVVNTFLNLLNYKFELSNF